MQHMSVSLFDGGRVIDTIDHEGVHLRCVMPIDSFELYPMLCSIDPYDTVNLDRSLIPAFREELENLIREL